MDVTYDNAIYEDVKAVPSNEGFKIRTTATEKLPLQQINMYMSGKKLYMSEKIVPTR